MVPHDVWVRQELIEATPGDITDYDIVRERIKELADEFNIQEIGYDPYQCDATRDATGIRRSQDGAGPAGHAEHEPASKHLEVAIRSHTSGTVAIAVLRWCVSNAAAVRDSNDNVRPDKLRSSEKIDGLVALIIALARMVVHQETKGSVYDHRGIDFI